MITANTAIQMSEVEINNLPKSERKKALKTRESWNRFIKVVEQVKTINLDEDINIHIDRPSPWGHKELPESSFHYDSYRKELYNSQW